MWMIWEMGSKSLREISELFGGLDHAALAQRIRRTRSGHDSIAARKLKATTQHASRTHSGGSLVLDRSANRMHAARPKNLTSRTAVDVSHPIIGKSLITKERMVMSAVGLYPGVSHVRGDPARLALHEVFSRSILVIGYHDLGLAIGILLVLIHQPH